MTSQVMETAEHPEATDTPTAEDRAWAMLAGPIRLFETERQPGEFDLIAYVRAKMVEMGLGPVLPAAFDNNRHILDGLKRTAHGQQYCLNQYLAGQFMQRPDSEHARQMRYALIYEISPDKWVTIFNQTILPTLVSLNLPVVI